MNVTVEERLGWFHSSYEISTPAGNFTAQEKPAWFRRRFDLIAADGSPAGFMESESPLWRDGYALHIQNGNIYHFEQEKFWSLIYVIHGEGGPYRFLTRQSSILQGEQKIATVKKHYRFWKGAFYEIEMSTDTNALILACMVILVRSIEQSADSSVIT